MGLLNQLVSAGGSLWMPGAFFQEVSLHVCLCVYTRVLACVMMCDNVI